MAIAVINQTWADNHYAAEMQCDSLTDVAKLPEYAKKYKIGLGSTCLCNQTSDVYAANSDGTWTVL